ncbi:MAG TPA: hypothetical protein VMF31_10545 [Solirubrobacterales bacterium]|nr:hypothetical protein [Solirubrobacterales bacterium]
MKRNRIGIHEPSLPIAAPSIIESPTATLTSFISLVMAFVVGFGGDVSWYWVAAPIIVGAGILSAFNPRWAEAHGVFYRHPALFTAALGYLIMLAAELLNQWAGTSIPITDDLGALVIGALTAIVGFAFPKNGYPEWFAVLFGPSEPNPREE